MTLRTRYHMKQVPSYRQFAKTRITAAKTTFVCNPVLHFLFDLLKLASLLTGFVGACIIYFNKPFWKNRRYTTYSIIAITSYCLVFTIAVVSFIQIKRIECRQFHLLKMAYQKLQLNKGATNQKGANIKQSKSKTKCSRIKK